MKKVYVVDLTKEEKAELLKLVGKAEARARKINRAHILLLAEEDRTDKDIAASRRQAQAYGQAGSVCGGFSLLRSSGGQEALEHADAR
jgi:hypothetical protein